MATTNFLDRQTPIYASWLNDVDASTYQGKHDDGTRNAAIDLYVQTGTGAVERTVQAKLRESVSVFDFMTEAEIADVQARTRTINVTAKILLALAASKNVHFPAGSYWLGSYAANTTIFNLTTFGDNLNYTGDQEVEFCMTSSAGVRCTVFLLTNNSHSHFGHFTFRDLNGSPLTSTGPFAYYMSCNASTSDWGDIRIDGVTAYGCTAGIATAGFTTSYRLKGIRVGLMHCVNTYYGYNGQGNGDGVKIDKIYFEGGFRSYFVYGVRGHEVDVYSTNNLGTSGSINITSYGATLLPTEGIKVRAVMRDNPNAFTPVTFACGTDLTVCTIRGVEIDLDVECDAAYYPITFYNYLDSSTTTTTVSQPHIVSDLKLRAVVDGNSLGVNCNAVYNTKGRMNLTPSALFVVTSAMLNNFYVDGFPYFSSTANAYEEGTWTPVVSGLSTAGTGTYTTQVGKYTKIGNKVSFHIKVIQTAHTGTGNMIVSLPFTSNSTGGLQTICHVAADSLTFTGQLAGLVQPGVAYVTLIVTASGAVAAGVAMDGACTLYITGEYFV